MGAGLIIAALAFVVVALLMFAILRVNLAWDPRHGWKPNQPEPPPPSQAYVALKILGYSVSYPALLLGALLHEGWLIAAAGLFYLILLTTRIVLQMRQMSVWRREQQKQGHLP
jgi:hypothetical protein